MTAVERPESLPRTYEVVVVAYRSAPLVVELLDRLGGDVPVVVVDNARGADGLPALLTGRPDVRYLEGPGRGFAAGANVGVRSCGSDVVVLCGPDCRPSTGQLDALVADVRGAPGVAQSCALAVDASGRVELGAAGWELRWWRAASHAAGLHYVAPRTGMWARPRPHGDDAVDWISGTVSALDREALLALGGFDESFFVYGEDVDLSRRWRAAGRRQILRSDLLVPHGSGSSGDSPARMSRLRGSSTMIDVRRRCGRGEREAIRLLLTLGAGGRALVYRLLRRPTSARWHEAYVRGLWWGPPDMG